MREFTAPIPVDPRSDRSLPANIRAAFNEAAEELQQKIRLSQSEQFERDHAHIIYRGVESINVR